MIFCNWESRAGEMLIKLLKEVVSGAAGRNVIFC